MKNQVQKQLHSRWTKEILRLLNNGTPQLDGSIVLDLEVVEYLKQLASTSFEQLSAEEKAYYDKETNEIFNVILARFPHLRLYLESGDDTSIFENLIKEISQLDDNTTINNLRRTEAWQLALAGLPKTTKANLTAILNAATRNGYRTVGELKALVREGSPETSLKKVKKVRILMIRKLFG